MPTSGSGKKSAKCAATPTGPDARSAAAVRDGEGLVQVEVHQVEAQVARADDAEQGVQIRAVAIHQAAAAMHQLNHLFDVLIKETQCVRVGEHHADDRVIAGGFQRFEVNVAALIRWDGDNCHAHHADRGGIGPVRGSPG